jgi:tetratricopeptide (TPR) repeat protein
MKPLAAAAVLLLGVAACADPPSAAALRDQAKAVHRRALEQKSPVLYEQAHQLYQQYLARYAAEPDAGMMAFFDGEALVRLQRWAEAATSYERSLALAPHSPRLAEIAYDDVIATKNAIDYDSRQAGDAGPRCPGVAPCPIAAPLQKLLRAFDRYLALVPQSKERPAVEYRRARIYYSHNQFAKAAPLFDAIVTQYPQHELAVYSANLEMDCLASSKRYRELRALVTRLEHSPVARDPSVAEQLAKANAHLVLPTSGHPLRGSTRDLLGLATARRRSPAAIRALPPVRSVPPEHRSSGPPRPVGCAPSSGLVCERAGDVTNRESRTPGPAAPQRSDRRRRAANRRSGGRRVAFSPGRSSVGSTTSPPSAWRPRRSGLSSVR